MTAEPDCRICGERPVRTFQRRGASYARCRRCHAITKILSPQQYDLLDVTHDPDPEDTYSDRVVLRKILEVEPKKRILLPFRVDRAESARFLDIGCGQGGYLVAARELGFEVIGVEPSEGHSATAREAFGLPVLTQRFKPGLFDAESFDLVMLSHVAEHIYYLNEFLETVLDVLVPGGVLLIITPNADSFVATVSGRFWVMLKPLDHVSLIAPRTIDFLSCLRPVECHVRTSEYPSEPATATAAAMLDALREVGQRAEFPGVTAITQPGHALRRRASAKQQWLRAALSVAAWPVHVCNMILDRQACLVIEVRKPVRS